MKVKAEQGGFKDVGLLDVTPDNYIVPAGEENVYHCRIEIKKFNPETGERISTPRIQKFDRKFFESFGLHNLKQLGYTVDILHDARKWEEENAEMLAMSAKEKAEAERKKAEADNAAEREQIKKEVIAELVAAGIEIPTTGKRGKKSAAPKPESGAQENPAPESEETK